jgi:phage/plasmid-like protein (TIGR03299 family)
MAHELTMRSDGTAEMAYLKGTEVPWHGLGQEVPPNSPIEVWRKEAGMDFEIVAHHPVVRFDDGEEVVVSDRVVLCRSDNRQPLGFVSTGYQIVQPSDVLVFFQDLVHTVGLEIETAGTLFQGRRFWALAKVGENAVHQNDKLRGYLLLTTSCDGTLATTAKGVTVRVVCNNTLSVALSNNEDAGGIIKIGHGTKFDATAVKEALGIAPKSFKQFMQSIKLLSKAPMSRRIVKARAETLFGEGGRLVRHVMDNFDGAATGFEMKGFAGTAWGFLNSVTEAVDHSSRQKKSPSHDFDYLLYGEGDRIKRQAYEMALEHAT